MFAICKFFFFVHIPSPPKHVHLRTAHIRASVTFIRIQIQLGRFLAQIFQVNEWIGNIQ
jgi:hypothetical protein